MPGVGSFDPCPWGLGVEIHGAKHPHWMGRANSPETFGHFGGAGTMMWVDPIADVRSSPSPTGRLDEWIDRRLAAVAGTLRRRRWRRSPGEQRFQHGDRVRVETIGDDGLPLVRYGFVGGLVGDQGPVVVMLDGDLKATSSSTAPRSSR